MKPTVSDAILRDTVVKELEGTRRSSRSTSQ
jgi:hypothetical protein